MVITIRRFTRIRKFRKKTKSLFLALQITAIWYCIIISATYLTSNTAATYNDVETIANSIHANWEENNENKSLDSSKINILVSSCDKIVAENKDYSVDVTEPVLYEIANSNNEIVEEGKIEGERSAGTSEKIMFSPDKEGHYKLVVFQETGSKISTEFVVQACGSHTVNEDKEKVEENQNPNAEMSEQTSEEEVKQFETPIEAIADNRQEAGEVQEPIAENISNSDEGKDKGQSADQVAEQTAEQEELEDVNGN
ncbi:hypothetical protein GKZ89_14050 [Bacillus mangrovi]|uniref:Amyloid fiber anchoring/assembly protein TapA n=1 Tax=Metabacillus mangrovi TaxID=1491830 RepID=A0A7X2V5X6_9BACI|nr:hypothetical protein [Metabacillus mangrovi]MTH54523.1 hypothetical protein [Metabacillus mangrovi]